MWGDVGTVGRAPPSRVWGGSLRVRIRLPKPGTLMPWGSRELSERQSCSGRTPSLKDPVFPRSCMHAHVSIPHSWGWFCKMGNDENPGREERKVTRFSLALRVPLPPKRIVLHATRPFPPSPAVDLPNAAVCSRNVRTSVASAASLCRPSIFVLSV